MEFKKKITILEYAGFDWFLIAEILDTSYEEVRMTSEGDD